MLRLFDQAGLKQINRLGLFLVLALAPNVCNRPGKAPPATSPRELQTQASPTSAGKQNFLEALTAGSWTRELGGPGPPFGSDRLVFTFANDGTYTSQLFTDYPVDPISGEWRVSEDLEGRFHLLLSNKTAQYYFLPQQCLIAYEKQSDSLLVSGGSLVGTQKLQRLQPSSPKQRQ